MFTVCPKCALTLVVTAADLRVAQGYVRCGRCSNVFNAIVGLSDDRAHSATGQGSVSTTSTTIIRKAPSIGDEPPHDPLSQTGESEAIYAEPDAPGVDFQEIFVEAPAPSKPAPPARAPATPKRSLVAEATRASPPVPPAPAARAASSGAATIAAREASPTREAPARSVDARGAHPKPSAHDDVDSIPDTSLEFSLAPADLAKVFVEPTPNGQGDVTGTFETIVMRSDDAPPDAPRDPEDVQLESDLRSLAARIDATGNQPAPKLPAAYDATIDGQQSWRGSQPGSPYNTADELEGRKPPDTRRARFRASGLGSPVLASAGAENFAASPEQHLAPPDEAAAEAVAEALAPPPAARGKRIAWIAGSAALGVVLVAQAIHHNRNDLATNARLNRPLTRFYAAIGVPLVPRWNLASYEVRQLGASTGEGNNNGSLTVRASLKNASTQPLPLPLLRITVQDRYGNRVATRDVAPEAYVPGAVPAGAHLGVGQRIDAEMSFKDPGQEAVGFEIDACLPAPGGGITCANDAATR